MTREAKQRLLTTLVRPVQSEVPLLLKKSFLKKCKKFCKDLQGH